MQFFATRKIFFLGMALCILFAITLYAYQLSQKTKNSLKPPQKIIEESMTGIKAYRFNTNGSLIQEMQMKQGYRYQHQSTFYLLAPKVRVYSNDVSWDIHAEHGQSMQQPGSNKVEKLYLVDHVEIKRAQPNTPATQSDWVLKTHSLSYFPASSLATTNDPITILSAETLIQANGLRADLHHHSIELLKGVNSRYAKFQS